MALTIEEWKLNPILEQVEKIIFKNKAIENLSNFQKRQCVFYYLVNNNEYDFSLLNNIYSGKIDDYADEIVSILKPEIKDGGLCHSFSYAYKILLDKLQIPCMLVVCEVKEESLEFLENKRVNTNITRIKRDLSGLYRIPHMLVLVQNEDGTFSFDDITYAIFNKGTVKEKEYFNYNYQMALQNRQTNFQGYDTDMLRIIVNKSKDTTSDEIFREKYGNRSEIGYLTIPIDLINSYKHSIIVEELEER